MCILENHARLAKRSYSEACYHAIISGIEMLKLHANARVSRETRGCLNNELVKGTGFKEILVQIDVARPTAYRWMEAAKIVLGELNITLEDNHQTTEFEKAVRKITNAISLNKLYLMQNQPQLGDTLIAITEPSNEDKIKQIQLQGIKLLASLDEYASRDFAALPKAEKKHICEVLRDQLEKLESSL